MNDFIKIKIKWTRQIYDTYIKSGRKESYYVKFQKVTNTVPEAISRHKEEYQTFPSC